MQKLTQHYSARKTPQTQPIPGSDQVKNSAGGYAWKITKWQQLERFLILGTEGGTYYSTEQKLTIKNASSVQKCINEDGLRVVKTVVDISQAGRAYKNDPALFVLAMCAGAKDVTVRKAALTALPSVARIGTHLFTFIEYVQEFRGWGRLLREAVAAWYQDKLSEKLAYQVAKYQQRDGWSHRDVLRLAKPVPQSETESAIFAWASGRGLKEEAPALLHAMEELKSSPEKAIELIYTNNLTREMIPTELLSRADVWEALLDKMPLNAMIRNLGNLSKVGLLKSMSDASKTVCERLRQQDFIKKSRVHPIAVLMALTTYASGHGARGHGEWDVASSVVDALNDAFYLSFGNIEQSTKRTLLALDVSSSMSCGSVSGCFGLTPRVASAAMAMMTARTTPNHELLGFSDRLVKVGISASSSLNDAVRTVSGIPFGGTNCALPMLWATKNKISVDTFVIYTDCETWFGNIHPVQALNEYRKQSGIPATMIVCAMTGNKFTIADPEDSGMLDVVGFDSGTPRVIADFS